MLLLPVSSLNLIFFQNYFLIFCNQCRNRRFCVCTLPVHYPIVRSIPLMHTNYAENVELRIFVSTVLRNKLDFFQNKLLHFFCHCIMICKTTLKDRVSGKLSGIATYRDRYSKIVEVINNFPNKKTCFPQKPGTAFQSSRYQSTF